MNLRIQSRIVNLFLLPLFALFFATNCGETHISITLLSPAKRALNDTVRVEAHQNSAQIDSLVITLDSFSQTLLGNSAHIYSVALPNVAMGVQTLRVKAFAGNRSETKTFPITVVSNVEPPIATYSVVNVFPRDNDFYTQGMEFVGNILYESAGEYGHSRLRKTDFKTGKVLAQSAVNDQFFGEGLTILNGKIFQLTWREQTGFVYDLANLQQISSFAYSTEGWGLTNDGVHLIMSDGSEFLYFLNPQTFVIERKIAVYDNIGAIQRLNELEYVNGVIYANIYTTDFIVAIDAATGKVLARYNFKNLLAPQYRTATTDVLNGIAFNKERGTFFITGKNWSKLFEVVFNN
ncbi:MAG: glutaminyl-peptide cyclotransferase [Bacteroidales bacterium]|jgi:glutamine cyclotransferase|nr:glutaminyl-peptide cyclotransferase [Bacteroidales bacterium]